jgi:hypothetical protein
MSNIEPFRPNHPGRKLIAASQATLEGVQELETLLEEIRDAMRGIDTSDMQTVPREKAPSGLLDIEDTKARHLAKCQQLATEIKQIVL